VKSKEEEELYVRVNPNATGFMPGEARSSPCGSVNGPLLTGDNRAAARLRLTLGFLSPWALNGPTCNKASALAFGQRLNGLAKRRPESPWTHEFGLFSSLVVILEPNSTKICNI
jgi:hypothetical protein